MHDDGNLEPLGGLPPELKELDAELRDLRITERSSFGPELRAELEDAWVQGDATPRPGARSRLVPHLAAAAVAALLFTGLAVPPARAALAQLSRLALERVGMVEQVDEEVTLSPMTVEPPPVPSIPAVLPTTPEPVRDPLPQVDPPPEVVDEAPPRAVSMTFPQLLDRAAEVRTVQRYYPEDLQRRGVGGTVRFRVWVNTLGRIDNVTLRRSSGVARLDQAGQRAVRELRFHPATRDGVAVGTWADLDLVFAPVDSIDAPTASTELPDTLPENGGLLSPSGGSF